jgi:hypothetical protein
MGEAACARTASLLRSATTGSMTGYVHPSGAPMAAAPSLVCARSGLRLARARPKPVLIAAGNAKFSHAGTVKIKIKLTAHGRQLLNHSKRLTLTAQGKFTPTAHHGIIATKTFKLTR